MLANIFLLIGTVIGAGIFSLPFVFETLGIYFFPLLFALTLISIYLSHAYMHIIKISKKKDQLPAYIEKPLGKFFSETAKFFLIFSLMGALTGYLMLINFAIKNVFYFLIPTWIILLFKRDLIEEVDDMLSFVLIVLLGTVIFTGFKNLSFFSKIIYYIKPHLTFKDLINSYGIILFSLTGFSIIPELNFKKNPRLSVVISYLVIFVIYSLFAFSYYPKSVLLTLTIVFAIITSYIPLSLVTEEILEKDINLPNKISKPLILFTPVIFFLIGGDDFLTAFSITGGVFIAILQILIILAYMKAKKQKRAELIVSLITLAILFFGLLALVYQHLLS